MNRLRSGIDSGEKPVTEEGRNVAGKRRLPLAFYQYPLALPDWLSFLAAHCLRPAHFALSPTNKCSSQATIFETLPQLAKEP